MGDFGGMSLAWAFQEWRDWHQERPLGTFSRMKRVSLGLLIEAFKKTGVNVMVKNSISNELTWGGNGKKTEKKKTSRFQALVEQMHLFQGWGMLTCPPQKRLQCPFGCPQERGTEKCSKCRTLAKTLHLLQIHAQCLKVFKIDQEGKIGLLWVYILRRTFENS